MWGDRLGFLPTPDRDSESEYMPSHDQDEYNREGAFDLKQRDRFTTPLELIKVPLTRVL